MDISRNENCNSGIRRSHGYYDWHEFIANFKTHFTGRIVTFVYTHTAVYKYYLFVWGKYFLTWCDSMSDLVGYSSELLPVVVDWLFFSFSDYSFQPPFEGLFFLFCCLVGPPLGGHCSLICPTMCGFFFPFAGLSHPFGGCVHYIEVMSMSSRSGDKSMAHVCSPECSGLYISLLYGNMFVFPDVRSSFLSIELP